MNLEALTGLRPGTPPPQTSYYRNVNAGDAEAIDEIACSVLRSWRYNPKGEFGVLYLASSPECAWREILKQVGGNAGSLKPRVVARFDVKLAACLDLTLPETRAKLDLSLEAILDPSDFLVPQSLARQARRLGFEAIIAPAAVGGGACHNLAVFKDRLSPPSRCECDPRSLRLYP